MSPRFLGFEIGDTNLQLAIGDGKIVRPRLDMRRVQRGCCALGVIMLARGHKS